MWLHVSSSIRVVDCLPYIFSFVVSIHLKFTIHNTQFMKTCDIYVSIQNYQIWMFCQFFKLYILSQHSPQLSTIRGNPRLHCRQACQITSHLNPQTASGGLRGSGTHSKLPLRFNFHHVSTLLSAFLKNIVLNTPLEFHEYIAKKAPPSDIGIKAWLKGPKWASQAQDLFSASDCLCY